MCNKCNDTKWVCESHPNLPFEHDDENCGGAGMLCECTNGEYPGVSQDAIILAMAPTQLKDSHDGTEGMTVYGISPWNDIEVLYVEPDTSRASTIFPSKESGAGACSHLTQNCFKHRENAETEIMINPKPEFE